MAKKKPRERQELESLIPSIKEAEKSMDDLLEGARAQAAELIQEAEAEAARRMQRGREGIPRLLATEREARLVSLQARAADVLEAVRKENRGLEKEAAERIDAAVALIVSRVWPDGPVPKAHK